MKFINSSQLCLKNRYQGISRDRFYLKNKKKNEAIPVETNGGVGISMLIIFGIIYFKKKAFEKYFPFVINSLKICCKMLANYGYYIVNIDYYYSDSVKKSFSAIKCICILIYDHHSSLWP